jgi:hypothetical protein
MELNTLEAGAGNERGEGTKKGETTVDEDGNCPLNFFSLVSGRVGEGQEAITTREGTKEGGSQVREIKVKQRKLCVVCPLTRDVRGHQCSPSNKALGVRSDEAEKGGNPRLNVFFTGGTPFAGGWRWVFVRG